MRAIITLEDGDGGAFQFNACFEGGWNKDSHAHQHAYLLLQHLNTIAQPMAVPTETLDANVLGPDGQPVPMRYTLEPDPAVELRHLNATAHGSLGEIIDHTQDPAGGFIPPEVPLAPSLRTESGLIISEEAARELIAAQNAGHA